MAGYSIQAVKDSLRLQPYDQESRDQREVVNTAVTSYRETVFSNLKAEEVKDFVANHRGTVQDKVNAGIECGKGFQADFEDLTELLMNALFDNDLINGLQDLLDSLNFIPPGFGLPSIDFDHSLCL